MKISSENLTLLAVTSVATIGIAAFATQQAVARHRDGSSQERLGDYLPEPIQELGEAIARQMNLIPPPYCPLCGQG